MAAMAKALPSKLVDRVAAPQHFMLPSVRDLRAQSVHRLQLGVLGLCCMLLLIGLANIIMDRAKVSNAANGGNASADSGSPKGAGDPFADIGVAPSTAPSETAAAAKQ